MPTLIIKEKMKIKKPKITAVILAGGDSRRLSGHAVPKQLLKINGRHIISYCLDIYQNLNVIDSIILVINNNFREIFETIIKKNKYNKIEKIIPGGKYRQESIFNGITAINSCDFVVIQNGVSILTPHELILKCIKKAVTHNAVSAFVREIYSSFTVNEDRIEKAVDRNLLGHVRDPQVFNFHLLLRVHEKSHQEHTGPFTNDIILLTEYGHEVYLVESPPNNFKVTSDIDIKLANILLKEAD